MQQSSPACNEEGVWKSVFITSHSSHPHTSSYGSQCATTTTTDRLWKSQETFCILMHAMEVLTSSNISTYSTYQHVYVIHHMYFLICAERLFGIREPSNRYSMLDRT